MAFFNKDRLKQFICKWGWLPGLAILVWCLGSLIPVWTGDAVAKTTMEKAGTAKAAAIAPVPVDPALLDSGLARSPRLVDLLEYARRKNPALAASEASWQAFIQARRLGTAYPDPKLMATFFPKPIETRLGPQDWNFSLTQPIPFPGLLSQKDKVLAANENLARLKWDQTLRELVTRITESWYELGYLNQARQLTRKNLELVVQMEEILTQAYGRDQEIYLNLSRVGIKMVDLENQIIRIEEQIKAEKIALNALLNREAEAPLGNIVGAMGVTPTAGLNLERIQKLALEHADPVLLAREKIRKAKARLELARLENKPSLSLGLFYAGIGEPDTPTRPQDAGEDALGIQFGISFPLWNGKRESRLAKARAELTQAQALLDRAVNQTRARVSRTWYKWEDQARTFALHSRETLPRTRRALGTAQAMFRQGRGGFSQLLELQMVVHDFELAMARAAADHAKYHARLEEQAGVILGPVPTADHNEKDIP